MGTPQSPILLHHSLTMGRSHVRRSSSYKSSCTTLSNLSTSIEAQRTHVAKDGDTFSYSPSYLPLWYCNQGLWDNLSSEIQSSLIAVQHAGAAVLTGFDRLDKHTEELDDGRPPHKFDEDELLVQLDDLPSPKMRTASNASSAFQSDFPSPIFTGSPISQTASPPTSSQAMSPISPICLTPSEPPFLDKHMRDRERSFSTPLEPNDAYYAMELSALRTEAIPRLRHTSRKVDTEWQEAKRTGSISAEVVNNFENWWAEKKCNILSLAEKGKRLSLAIGLAPTGMGWCAP